jgi:hypothetical protein
MVVVESFTVIERDLIRRYINDGGKAAAAAVKLCFGLKVGVAQGADE